MAVTRAETTAATRSRIIEVATELFSANWFEDVSLTRIAEAAGVSHQTVLNHFESKEGLALAMWQAVGAETVERRNTAKRNDVPKAVHVLVGEYERFGDSNARWAATAERLGSLAPLLDEARGVHQQWLNDMFGDALPTRSDARARCINALHAATDVYTWKLLRRDLKLSRAETERTMVELANGVLLQARDRT
ncbi:MAG: hypothetical protein QOJ00_367 [Actinomycetota bacterium]